MERIEKYKLKYDGEVLLSRLKKRKEDMMEYFSEFSQLQSDQDFQLDFFLSKLAKTSQPAPDQPPITYVPNYGQYRDWFLDFLRRLKCASAHDMETLHSEWLTRGFTEDLWSLLLEKFQLQRETRSRYTRGKLICEWFIAPHERVLYQATVKSEIAIYPQ
jgi:hypothetical protein